MKFYFDILLFYLKFYYSTLKYIVCWSRFYTVPSVQTFGFRNTLYNFLIIPTNLSSSRELQLRSSSKSIFRYQIHYSIWTSLRMAPKMRMGNKLCHKANFFRLLTIHENNSIFFRYIPRRINIWHLRVVAATHSHQVGYYLFWNLK